MTRRRMGSNATLRLASIIGWGIVVLIVAGVFVAAAMLSV